MQFKDARKKNEKWGKKSCDHPSFEKEHYLGSSTGDYVCRTCGHAISKDSYNEIIELRKKDSPNPSKS